ncbi:MAG: GntR family transcriptional regulator, partial [Candidatus Tumulicola sp.]
MPAVLTVDSRSGVPIYLQIIEQIKRSVALGILQAGEQLPTVKQLALDLTINPNTVARAYRDLERDSVIETAPGRGSFVRTDGAAESAKTAAGDVARG